MLVLQHEHELQAADPFCTRGRQDTSHQHLQAFQFNVGSCQQTCSGSWEQLSNLCALQHYVVRPSSALETCKKEVGKSLKSLKYQSWLSGEHPVPPQASPRHTVLHTSPSSHLQPSFQRWMTTFLPVVW